MAKKTAIIILSCILGLMVLWVIIMLSKYWIQDYLVKHDSNLLYGFNIVERKEVTAENDIVFKTVQVEKVAPKTPYRLYVYSPTDDTKPMFFVDSYKEKIEAKVSIIMSTDKYVFYTIENHIIYYNKSSMKYDFTSAESLKAIEQSDEKYNVIFPAVEKLSMSGSWFWLYEGADFLLKTQNSSIKTLLKQFEMNNTDKRNYTEPYYRSELTYDKMILKCQEILQKYGGEQQ